MQRQGDAWAYDLARIRHQHQSYQVDRAISKYCMETIVIILWFDQSRINELVNGVEPSTVKYYSYKAHLL